MEKCFATEKEIKKRCIAVPKNKKATACGPTLFSDEFADYVVAEEGHTMCFGGTGSGKTTRILSNAKFAAAERLSDILLELRGLLEKPAL